MKNKIINGDCNQELKRVPDNSVDFVLTSPPYDGVRDYDGFQIDFQKLGSNLFRVMKKGAVCGVVIQDGTKDFKKSLTSFRLVLDWCDKAGFSLFETCIYYRQGRPGAWWNQRFRVDHEFIFIFLKGDKPKFFDKAHLDSDVRSFTIKGTFRKTDGDTERYKSDGKVYDKASQGTVFHYNSSNADRIPDRKVKLEHPATFPDKLASDFIRCFTREGEMVLDPMCGSGTTCRVACLLNRHYIGIEISESYCEIANQRMNLVKNDMFVGVKHGN